MAKLGAQYVIVLEFDNSTEGSVIDHHAMEELIKNAVQEKLAAMQNEAVEVSEVVHETTYPIPPAFVQKSSYLVAIEEIDECDVDDADELIKLLQQQRSRLPVLITSVEVAVDGGDTDYYNVLLTDGTVVTGLAGKHLFGVNQLYPKR